MTEPKRPKINLSLLATIAVIVITGVVGYYMISLKKAPYDVADFDSFVYKWGIGPVLENSYSSINGDYQYLDNRDSLIKTKVKLRANDMIFIHNKINELGFWNLPSTIGKPNRNNKSLVFELQFKYKKKSKKITIYGDLDDNPGVLDSAIQIKNVLQKAIDEAEARYNR